MGQVFRARDTKLDRDVAIKVLPEAFAHDTDRLARFAREAKTLASLNHPHIAGIYGLEESGGVTGLVMELVEGEDLSQRIARGAIPLDEALPIARQIADALEAAHEQGIIHRDLKPANIKVRIDGAVKVLDFGLAKAMEPAAGSSPSVSMSPTLTTPAMTQAGIILGTAAYMSPEQAKGRAVDKRADIWAFGVVLYEMVTGARGYAAEDVSDTLAAVLTREVDWTTLPSTTPPRLVALLRDCLVRDPKQRLRDMGEARRVLDQLITGASGSAILGPASSLSTYSRVRSAVFVASLCLVSAVIAGGAVRAFWKPTVDRPVTQFVITPPSGYAYQLSPQGMFTDLAIDPQGSRVALAMQGSDGRSQLFIRRLDKVALQPVAGSDGAVFPFWSPNGEALGFFADGRIKRVDLKGGGVQVVATAGQGLTSGTWLLDQKIVSAAFAGGGLNAGLSVVSATGGEITTFTTLGPSEVAHRYPQALPDGSVLFIAQSRPGSPAGIVCVASHDGAITRLPIQNATRALYDAGRILVIRDQQLLTFDFDFSTRTITGSPTLLLDSVRQFAVGGGTLAVVPSTTARLAQLQWFNRSGQEVGPAFDGVEDRSISLSPDGNRVATDRAGDGRQSAGAGAARDVWIVDLARNVSSRFTFEEEDECCPIWSPDGNRVAYPWMKGGQRDIFVKPAAGGEARVLVGGALANKFPKDWSRDGRYVLFETNTGSTAGLADSQGGLRDLWAVPTSGDEKPFAVVNSRLDESGGQFSPDGKLVAYAAVEARAPDIFVVPFPPNGSKWQVSSNGGYYPRWRRDGRELFYVTPDGTLTAVDVLPGTDFRVSAPKKLFHLDISPPASAIFTAKYDVSADGQRFIAVIPSHTATESMQVTVTANWPTLLKK